MTAKTENQIIIWANHCIHTIHENDMSIARVSPLFRWMKQSISKGFDYYFAFVFTWKSIRKFGSSPGLFGFRSLWRSIEELLLWKRYFIKLLSILAIVVISVKLMTHLLVDLIRSIVIWPVDASSFCLVTSSLRTSPDMDKRDGMQRPPNGSLFR